MKTVYLFLATGFEEIEALTIVDMLRRAEIDITTVSISRNLQVEGAHGITVTADCTWVELSTEDADWLILPGGMPGTKHLGECKPLVSLLQRQAAANKNIAAICAAPSVLGQAGLLNGYKATCCNRRQRDCRPKHYHRKRSGSCHIVRHSHHHPNCRGRKSP